MAARRAQRTVPVDPPDDAPAGLPGPPDERARLTEVLDRHADVDGYCVQPRCGRSTWPCPPAESASRELAVLG